jgi:cyanophycinase
MFRHLTPTLFALWIALAQALPGAEPQKAAPERQRIDPNGISGSLLIAGGGALPDAVMDRFVEIAGGDKARVVVIPTASQRADDEKQTQAILERWKERIKGDVQILHTRSREEADQAEFVAPLQSATAVWFVGGQQSRIAAAYLGTRTEKELLAVLERGGIIGGTSAGAAIQSRVMIASGNPVPTIATGFDLLPSAIVDQHFLVRERMPRLKRALKQHPTCFGLGIDEQTAVLVQGRRLRVLGESTATVVLAETDDEPAAEVTLRPGAMADLTALRRAARDRTAAAFPPEEPASPLVKKGALVIVGGGVTPEIGRRFIKLAGGADEARIVVLPTASGRPFVGQSYDASNFEKLGAKNVTVLPARKLKDVESEQTLATLKKATGVWFSGGRQWRFVDAYEHTKALAAFRGVLKRGGVIGGSSAGASIQAEYLVRGNPLGNRDMMALGYERGFCFLPGTAIDQHFTQRKRFDDLKRVVVRYPQLLGIGIDERTALIVRGHVAEVLGKHAAHFCKHHSDIEDIDHPFIKVESGERFDLKSRTILTSP